MDSPALLSVYERCNRLGIWCRDWEKSAPDANEMLQRAIMAGLTTDGKNHGQIAGEECFSMGPTCGLQTCATSVHDQVVHLSSLGDILVTALRKPQEGPWMPAGEVQLGEGPIWVSNAFLNQSGDQLRRIVTVSAWNDDRHFHECRTWASLGEVGAFQFSYENWYLRGWSETGWQASRPLKASLPTPRQPNDKIQEKEQSRNWLQVFMGKNLARGF